MSLVRRLRGVTFEWGENAPAALRGRELGVIAQEVEAVFPELVQTDASGMKRVNYQGLIAPLIEAVKELDERLTRLEQRLDGDAGG
jgi:trimeric autotransporter adhesin